MSEALLIITAIAVVGGTLALLWLGWKHLAADFAEAEKKPIECPLIQPEFTCAVGHRRWTYEGCFDWGSKWVDVWHCAECGCPAVTDPGKRVYKPTAQQPAPATGEAKGES